VTTRTEEALRRIAKRLRMLPPSERTGSVTLHFARGEIRKVEWRTLDDAEEWDDTVAERHEDY